jgi:hypothetical protein
MVRDDDFPHVQTFNKRLPVSFRQMYLAVTGASELNDPVMPQLKHVRVRGENLFWRRPPTAAALMATPCFGTSRGVAQGLVETGAESLTSRK